MSLKAAGLCLDYVGDGSSRDIEHTRRRPTPNSQKKGKTEEENVQ